MFSFTTRYPADCFLSDLSPASVSSSPLSVPHFPSFHAIVFFASMLLRPVIALFWHMSEAVLRINKFNRFTFVCQRHSSSPLRGAWNWFSNLFSINSVSHGAEAEPENIFHAFLRIQRQQTADWAFQAFSLTSRSLLCRSMHQEQICKNVLLTVLVSEILVVKTQ